MEVIKGDNTKGIKSIGELALRISKFDSYRLFTLYENVKERKPMDVSGGHKYYLVFKSQKKEIRIPEYEPKGFFEVDKVNGCILFKITKKNAEDILGMKTGGDKIFHIIRVFEEVDMYGKVLNVTDEVEVYNGKWGDDYDFANFSTENKVDLLTKSVAVQVDKNARLFNEYNDLLNKYNGEVTKNGELERELIALRNERDSLQLQVDEFNANTYDGTVLSTDTKYIAFEDTMDNISFTEEQYSDVMHELMTKGEVDLTNYDLDDPRVELEMKIYDDKEDATMIVYRNDISIGTAKYNQSFYKTEYINDGDIFNFELTYPSKQLSLTKRLRLKFTPVSDKYKNSVVIENESVDIVSSDKFTIVGKIKFSNHPSLDEDGNQIVDSNGNLVFNEINAIGNIGKISCYIN